MATLIISISCAPAAHAARKVKPPPEDEAPSGYTIVALDASPGFAKSVALDVETSDGVTLVVGHMREADEDKAMLWKVTPSESGYEVQTQFLPDGTARWASTPTAKWSASA